jgi:hypothetical protein
MPLVCPIDNFHNLLSAYHLPYSRILGGLAALVIAPRPGDIGRAGFAPKWIFIFPPLPIRQG